MNDDLKEQRIDIESTEDRAKEGKIYMKGVPFGASKALTFSFFKLKKDGKPTKAFEQYQEGLGSQTLVKFKETPGKSPKGDPITYRNVAFFKPVGNTPSVDENLEPMNEPEPTHDPVEPTHDTATMILWQVAFKGAIEQTKKVGDQIDLQLIENLTQDLYDILKKGPGKSETKDEPPLSPEQENEVTVEYE